MSKMKQLEEPEKTESKQQFDKFCSKFSCIETDAYVKYQTIIGQKSYSKTQQIKIDFGESENGGRVNIHWNEDDYHDKGLFGFYDAYYCKMNYYSDCFEIIDTNGRKIIIT